MQDQAQPQSPPQDPYEVLIAAGVDPSPLARAVIAQAVAVLCARNGTDETWGELQKLMHAVAMLRPMGSA